MELGQCFTQLKMETQFFKFRSHEPTQGANGKKQCERRKVSFLIMYYSPLETKTICNCVVSFK